MASLPQSTRNGRIIHEDPYRVVIATGFAKKSDNVKTGNMLQVFILVKSVNPYEAIKNGKDKLICDGCEHLKSATLKRRQAGIAAKDDETPNCYVVLMHGPAPVWDAYKRGCYRKLESIELFRGRFVRFGTYGDPSYIPYNLIKAIASVASGFTGYTHRWHKPLVQRYSDFFSASTNPSNRAQAMGWRTFTVSNEKTGNDFLCPASKPFEVARGYRLTCEQCGQCKGNASKALSTYIPAH